MICVLTPTGDRPDAFSLCVRYVNRQTRKPDLWVIVDDGKTESASALDAQIDVPHLIIRLDPVETNSVCRNLRTALDHVSSGSSVCVMEDDDWYPENYLETMEKLLQEAPFVCSKTCDYYHVKTRQYKTVHASSPMHGNGFSGDAVAAFRKLLGEHDGWDIDKLFGDTWTGKRAFNEQAKPLHIIGFGEGRPGTTPSHRISGTKSGYEQDPNGAFMARRIGEDVHHYLSDTAKVYVFSNVQYEESRKLKVNPEDFLVFLNKAASVDYYKDHKNKVIYHRSPKPTYGEERLNVLNRYVYDAGLLAIPKNDVDHIRSAYDWGYSVEKGCVKSATTGYMVVKYMEMAYPLREIVLVNFGYAVEKSTYRCPWHNWVYEARELEKFRHVFTADTKEDGVVKSDRRERSDYEKEMSEIFVYEGSDKMVAHDYGGLYAEILSSLRGKAAKIIEIGGYKGATMRALPKLLPDAVVYGVNQKWTEETKPQATLLSGDGYAESLWKDLPSDFDFIIEDGTHRRDDILRGLPLFISHLSASGVLLIEDIPTEEDATEILRQLPGAVLHNTLPISKVNDDRVIIYRKDVESPVKTDPVRTVEPERQTVPLRDRIKPASERALVKIFNDLGCDQMTRHDYSSVYEQQFAELRGSSVRIAVISTKSPKVVAAVAKSLPLAEIYGIGARIKAPIAGATAVVGDAYSEKTWEGLPSDFALILEDGTHRLADLQRGIPIFRRHLTPGGSIMIEDIPSEDDVTELLSALPGAVCHRTTPISPFHDDRILTWTNGDPIPDVTERQRSDYELTVISVFSRERSDKVTLHDYGEVYAQQLARLINKKAVIAEIGGSRGAGLRALCKLLPDAAVYGIGSRTCGDRAICVPGDAYDVRTWEKLPATFDLIIEDGTHRLSDILRGLPAFLGHLAPDGVLLIEDVASEDDVTEILSRLPGAVCCRTTPISKYHDDRIILYPGTVSVGISSAAV